MLMGRTEKKRKLWVYANPATVCAREMCGRLLAQVRFHFFYPGKCRRTKMSQVFLLVVDGHLE